MKKIVTLTLFLVFLVVLGSGVFTVYAVFWGGKEVSVPSLEGMSIIEAVDVAQRMGLVVRVDQVDSLKKSGLVLSQWPAAGTLVKNGKVLILKVVPRPERRLFRTWRGGTKPRRSAFSKVRGSNSGLCGIFIRRPRPPVW